jgi:hypothetical protein
VVISKHWLLTAGHCVREAVAKYGIYSSNRLTIRTGAYGPTGTVVYSNGAASFYMHPDYDRSDGDFGDDLALIQLYGSGMGSYTRAFIMGETNQNYFLPGKLGLPRVAGYGRGTAPGGGEACPAGGGGWKRSGVFVPLLNRLYKWGTPTAWSPGSPFMREIILKPSGSRACKGDSGGPVYFNYDGSDKVAGIHSGSKYFPYFVDSYRGPSIRRKLQWIIDTSIAKSLPLTCQPRYSNYGPDYWSCTS